MPSHEQYSPHIDLPYHTQELIGSQPQAKVCSSCQATLVDPTAAFQDAQVVCTLCRDRPNPLLQPPELRQLRIDQNSSYPVRQSSHEVPVLPSTRRRQESIAPPYDPAPAPSHSSPTYTKKNSALSIQCNNISPAPFTPRHQTHFPLASSYGESNTLRPASYSSTAFSPDPLADITRLRIRSRAHHCLYPGATFQGTQKSGRNSYDVNVTIVDVNFASSTLCGYLRIRGLTDDWPELTTYFDAEIIGNRYGFLTQNWGATQHEDLVHWSRFPAFKHIRHEAKRPHMTIDDRDRGVVFMRWKERFLVPDHRVQDINGASFAGFYYVCVDFNPPVAASSPAQSCPTRSMSQPALMTPGSMDDLQCFPTPINAPKRSRRDSSVRRRGALLAPLPPPVATMSGFYYHQNSEPYQQLSLSHVPEQTSSSFEFR